MAIELNDNIDNKSPKILDKRYSIDGVTPYVDVAEANATIPLSYRAKGLTVLIGNQEYWYKDGIQDADLVIKSPSDFCSITLHKDVVLGPDVNFVHTNGGSEVDNIDTGVAITRASAQAIFNSLQEAFYHYDISPKDTLWNADGWGNLADLQNRTYQDLANCLNYSIGSVIVGSELVMWDTINNKYYKFNFTQWTQAGGGTYATNSIDISTLPVDGTVVSIGSNPLFLRTYTYNAGLNQWTNLLGQSYTTLAECVSSDYAESQVYTDWGSPILTFTANVPGTSGNSIATTVSPVQVGFAFTNPTMSGATGGGGGFAYTRNLVTQTCDGTITFDDGSTQDTAPKDTKNIILVDGVFGDDTTAQPYNMLKPFKTINKAYELSKSGDTIVLNPSPTQYLLTDTLWHGFNGTKFLNFYISAGAVLSAAQGGTLTYNRILVKYNNLAGGVFAVSQSITVNGCALGSILSIDSVNNVLEIASGNQVTTPEFSPGNVISNGIGVTASLVSNTNSNSPENNISITGDGSLVLRGMNFNGGYAGTFTIDVMDFYNTGMFYYGQASYGIVNINCNKIVLNNIIYFDSGPYNYGGIGLITYNNQISGPFLRGWQITNGAGVTAYVLQDDGAGYINIYNIQGGNFSPGDTISVVGGPVTTSTVVTSKLTTTPIAFNLNAKAMILNTIIIGIFPAGVSCNWNIGTYRKTAIEANLTHQIFFYGGVAPQFDVVSNINFSDFLLNASTTNYMQSIFYMASGQSLKGKYFFTGYYNVTAGIPATGQTATLIQLNGNTIQTIEFNGVATLKNMGFINEISNYIDNYSYSRVTARGSVSIDNSAINYYWGLILSGILISNSKLKMYADLIYDAPINFAILVGSYTSLKSVAEVDIIDCQIVNKNQSCLLSVIGVGFSGGSGVLPPLTLPSKMPLQIFYALSPPAPDFVGGETISNGLGATGVVYTAPNGTDMYITTVVGEFLNGDTITGATSGASAQIQNVVYWANAVRIKNAVIVGNTEIQNSIEGAYQGQPYQVYTGYSNKPQSNMVNQIAGTNYIVDSDINSNNF